MLAPGGSLQPLPVRSSDWVDCSRSLLLDRSIASFGDSMGLQWEERVKRRLNWI